MKWLFSLALSLATIPSFAQQRSVVGEKELIARLDVGRADGSAWYELNEEGFYSPGPPLVDDAGRVWLFPSTTGKAIVFDKGAKEVQDFPIEYPRAKTQASNGISQEGRFGFSWRPSSLYTILEGELSLKNRDPSEFYIYDMPWGEMAEYRSYSGESKAVSIQYEPNLYSMVKSVDRKYTARGVDATKSWIVSQPGGFSVGDDGRVYRNGFLFSAFRPRDTSYAGRYVGRLASGHVLWCDSSLGAEKFFVVATPAGKTELVFSLPWGRSDKLGAPGYHNWGVGAVGELYCLVPPDDLWERVALSGGGARYIINKEKDIKGGAELVVVRNHLKYFGRLNDDNVRLRKEPSPTADILGTYPAKTGFRILEKGTKEETIAGAKNVWYKVRLLDGKEGWFFGAFVQNLYDGPNGDPPPWPNLPDW